MSSTPRLWLYDGARCLPNAAVEFTDTDDEWADILSDPEVAPLHASSDKEALKVWKNRSPAVCGAEFPPGCDTKNLSRATQCHALVLDVDVWHDENGNLRVNPFTLDDLKTIFEGFRFIAWNSFSSTDALRKWRVVIPLAFPMPVKKYRPLWKMLNEHFLQHTMAESTKDPIRLGFCRTLASDTGLQDYKWHIQQGDRLDWTLLNLEDDQTPTLQPALKPTDFALAPDASSPVEALSAAKRYYRKVGQDVEVGNRHDALLQASVRLWYEWAAPNEQFVFDVLKTINENFQQPKSEQELWDEVKAGWERTLGPNRVEQPSPYGCQREPLERASRTGFAELSRAVGKRQKEGARIVSRALKHVAAGEAFTSEPAEAKNVAHLLAKEIGQAYPKEKAERLLDLVRPSLNAQRALSSAYPVPTDEEFISTVKFTQNAIRKRMDEREAVRQDNEKRLIAQAFTYVGIDRVDPYSINEYRKWEASGFSNTQWVLQHGREFYFWIGGAYYGPVKETEAKNFYHVFLAPAKDRITLSYLKEGVAKKRPFDEIVQEHGSMVRDVERSFCHNKTSYNEMTQRLIWGRLAMRPLEPLFDPDIDAWLHLLARDKYPLLEEWMVGMFHLDRASAALLISPPPRSGKNLLTYGLARLWNESGPTALVDNEGKLFPAHHLERCPLVFSDEKLPYLWQKEFSPRLRAATSELSRNAKQPYISDYTLTGAARYAFAGNSASATFAVKNFDTPAERQALMDRVLIITHDDTAAQQFLDSKPHHRLWVEQDLLARHVHWLAVNRPLSSSALGKRFLGSDPSPVTMDAVVTETRAEKQHDVLEWIYTFVSRKRFNTSAVVSKGGVIYVSGSLVAEYWSLHDPTGRGIKTREVTSAIAALAPDRAKLGFPDGTEAWYRKLDVKKLAAWLESNGVDVEPLVDALKELEAAAPFTIK